MERKNKQVVSMYDVEGELVVIIFILCVCFNLI